MRKLVPTLIAVVVLSLCRVAAAQTEAPLPTVPPVATEPPAPTQPPAEQTEAPAQDPVVPGVTTDDDDDDGLSSTAILLLILGAVVLLLVIFGVAISQRRRPGEPGPLE